MEKTVMFLAAMVCQQELVFNILSKANCRRQESLLTLDLDYIRRCCCDAMNAVRHERFFRERGKADSHGYTWTLKYTTCIHQHTSVETLNLSTVGLYIQALYLLKASVITLVTSLI